MLLGNMAEADALMWIEKRHAARSPIVLVRVLGLIALSLFSELSCADELMTFVAQVMRTEIDYSNQFLDAERFSIHGVSKSRWPDAAHAHADRLKLISRQFLLDNDIDPAIGINSYSMDDYQVLGRLDPLIFIRQRYKECEANGCIRSLVITLNVTKEAGRYLLRPGEVPSKGRMLAYWWSVHEGPFDLPGPEFCAINSKQAAQMRATVDAFMPMMAEGSKDKYTRRQRLEHIARAYFQEQGVEPALVDVDNYGFYRYGILGVYGPYVDVELIGKPGCPTCGKRFLRLKPVIEDGTMRLMPSERNKNLPTAVPYWWSFGMDQHVPLCAQLGAPSSRAARIIASKIATAQSVKIAWD